MEGKYFTAKTTAKLAKMNLKNIIKYGNEEIRDVGSWCMKKPKKEKLLETYSVTFELTRPKKCISSQHCLATEIETEDYFSGLNPGFVHLSPWSFYSKWIEEDGKYHYTYGERGGSRIFEVIKKLKDEPTTRHCVVNLFSVSENDLNHSFVPCTTQWYFYIANDALNMVTIMRSQDACRGFFLDTFAYPLIQQIIAKSLDIPLGHYYHTIMNSHIYSDDVDFAKKLIKSVSNVEELNIDTLSKNDIKIMEKISNLIYYKHDTKAADELSKKLPEFWRKWKANQIIWIYTKYIQKEPVPTQLTVAGPINNVMP